MFNRPVGILPRLHSRRGIYLNLADQTCPRSREIAAHHRAKRAPIIL